MSDQGLGLGGWGWGWGRSGTMPGDNRVQDGQRQCVRGAWVKISEEYKDWDVFRKFVGRVGRLTTR